MNCFLDCLFALIKKGFGVVTMYQGTLSITRRMKMMRSDIYKSMLSRRDFEIKLAKLRETNDSQQPTICAAICGMFNEIGVMCENGRDYSYYEELIRNTDLPSFEDIELRIMETMFENFEQYPTPEVYMSRIVKRLSNPSDGWNEDSIRLQILKRFIKYCDCLSFQAESGKVHVYGGDAYLKKYAKEKKGSPIKKDENFLEYIDEGAFKVLSSATKAQLKSDGTYGILKLADDLAQGKFKAGGATKRDLYMFAIAFMMTYSANSDPSALETEEIVDYNSDIEKNLFNDYYANNLMRFITAAYDGNLSAFELDPSGQGINYKNFAEMVYIYFISKDCEKYTPSEKLKKATEMIERLKQTKKSSPFDDNTTCFYKTLFTEEILALSETEFESFISENYDCDVEFEDEDKNGKMYKGKKGALQLQTSQNTAFDKYNEIIKKMEHGDSEVSSLLRENCNYGLWFVDVSMIEKTSRNVLRDFSEGKDPDKIDRFIKLLYGINMFLGQLFIESESSVTEEQEHTDPSKRMIKKMSIEKPEDLTRTALITAFYYWYNQRFEQSGTDKNLFDVFNDYTDSTIGLNYYLEAAGYQPINDKNIFDLAVIFSSYAYLTV